MRTNIRHRLNKDAGVDQKGVLKTYKLMFQVYMFNVCAYVWERVCACECVWVCECVHKTYAVMFQVFIFNVCVCVCVCERKCMSVSVCVCAYWLQGPPPWGGFLYSMLPHQEPRGRGPPSKNLYQVLRGGPLPPGSWLGNIVNRKPPGGGFPAINIYVREFLGHNTDLIWLVTISILTDFNRSTHTHNLTHIHTHTHAPHANCDHLYLDWFQEYTFVHTYIHIHIYMYIHTYIHIHLYIYL